MRVLIAAGGTGGHIFPALAVAEELRSRSTARAASKDSPCRIEFVGGGRELEARLISAAGFPLHRVAARGLKGIGGWRKLRNFVVLPRSFWDVMKVLRVFRPDVVVGMGGYAGGPVMLEASIWRTPTLLIEPNVTPGFTNRVLAPLVRLAAVGFESAGAVYGPKARFVGHPVRAAFHRIAPKVHAPPYTVLILGGSQGSKAINDAMIGTLPLFAGCANRFRIVHQAGSAGAQRVREAYAGAGVDAEITEFIDDVPRAFEAADLVVSRAGASTVAELAAAGKAALLVPFPAAADDHQLANARALERAGGARILEQRDLTPQRLFNEVCELCRPEALSGMDRRARGLARPDAAAAIADLVEELAGSRHRR
ncbi:MAG: undecaprenyldiphospho-muramoylpentapeptide beta-N-acetylglucosaminyltransferase [Terriglobia bacterium]